MSCLLFFREGTTNSNYFSLLLKFAADFFKQEIDEQVDVKSI